MKKICTLILISLGILMTICLETQAQSATAARKKIEQANKHFVKWFNTAQPDSIITQYHADACMTGRGCGKDFIYKYYQTETRNYTIKELTTLDVTLKDNIATETGQWKILLPNGVELIGKYSTEWKQLNNRWMILKETVLE